MKNIIVAASKSWFEKHPKSNDYKKLSIYNIKEKKDLCIEKIEEIQPRYIFFPHWSWKVPSEIYEHYECVAFHTAPLPYGRGGSPIQNLILNGFKASPLCALRMNKTLDGGPIYSKQEVSLEGTIDEIFSRIAKYSEKMIIDICKNNTIPVKQKGNPFIFERLKYKDNQLDNSLSLLEIYDRIRMVDGVDYKSSYINFGRYKIEFKNAGINDNEIVAEVKIYKANKD